MTETLTEPQALTALSFPELLQQQMQRRGHSAQDVADATGINAISVRNTLNGKSFPNKKSIDAWARYLEIASEELLGLKPGRGGKSAKSGAKSGEGRGGRRRRRMQASSEGPSSDDGAGDDDEPARATPRSSAEHAAGNGARGFCEIEIFGNRFVFHDADEVLRFLKTDGIRVRILGRERRFADLGGLHAWAEHLRAALSG